MAKSFTRCLLITVVAFLPFTEGITEVLPQDASHNVTTQITVSGEVDRQLKLSVRDLRRLPAWKTAHLPPSGRHGARSKQSRNYTGVLLTNLLDQAGMRHQSRNDLKRMVIIARASDGYEAIFSWGELYNSPVGEGVLVAYEKNGAPLGADEGRIALISARDIHAGPRHVKWLKNLEVRKL